MINANPRSKNIVSNKSFDFAVRMVNLCKFLQKEKNEYIISKQILRSGTSVGANIREAEHASSKKDFAYKMSIAQREINETIYWLELLHATDYITSDSFESLHFEAKEVIKLLAAIIISTNKNL